jgi:predicted cytidylate kinase
MIITISGLPGSGKSTVAKLLAKRLKMKRYYMGLMRRRMAEERGISLQELNKIGETQEWTDKTVDEYQRELGKKEDNFVIEGRTSFHFIPSSVKVLLIVDVKTGAKRIFGDIRSGGRRTEGEPGSLGEMEKSIRKRMASDEKRYKKYYNLDIMDKSHYDIVIDTTDLTPGQVVERILASVKKIAGKKK